MAEDSWPGPNHSSDAVVDAEYEQLVAPYTPSGIIGLPSDSALIFGDSSGRVIKIRANRFGLVRGRIWSSGGSDTSKSIAANASGSTRFDLVVLQLDRSTLDVRVAVITGTPGSGPPTPTVQTGTTGKYEIALATVKVVSGASVINNADVTPVAYFLAPQSINCTSTTRPPHAAGLRIYETDTKKQWLSDGTTWTNTIEDTGWTAISMASGWTGTVNLLRKRNGIVFLQLQVTRNSTQLNANTPTTIGTLPAGYRPDQQQVGGGSYSTGPVRLRIDTSGALVLTNYVAAIPNGGFVSLDTVSFPAA